MSKENEILQSNAVLTALKAERDALNKTIMHLEGDILRQTRSACQHLNMTTTVASYGTFDECVACGVTIWASL
jgi:hypothetical protein